MSTNLDIYLEKANRKDLATALSNQLAVDKKSEKIVFCCRQNCVKCLFGQESDCAKACERYLLKEAK